MIVKLSISFNTELLYTKYPLIIMIRQTPQYITTHLQVQYTPQLPSDPTTIDCPLHIRDHHSYHINSSLTLIFLFSGYCARGDHFWTRDIQIALILGCIASVRLYYKIMTMHTSSTATSHLLSITFAPNVRTTTSLSAYLPIGILAILCANILGILLFLLHRRRRRRQSKHTYIDPYSPEDQGGTQYWRPEDLDSRRQINAIPVIPNVNHPSFLSISEEIEFLRQQLDRLKAQVEETRLWEDQISYGHGNHWNTIWNDDILNTFPLLDLDVTPPPAYTADSRSHMAIPDLSEDDNAPNMSHYPQSIYNGRGQG